MEAQDATAALSTAREELYQSRAAGDMSLEEAAAEAEAHKQQLEKSLRQNKSLLQRMAELERQLDKSVTAVRGNPTDSAALEGERQRLDEVRLKLKVYTNGCRY